MTAIGFSPRTVCSGAGNGAGQPLTREFGPELTSAPGEADGRFAAVGAGQARRDIASLRSQG